MKQNLLILAIVMMAASCSKERQPAPQAPSKKLIEFQNLTQPNLSARYSYNLAGQLTRMNQDRYASVYQHSAEGFYFQQLDTTINTVISERINGIKDSKGRVVSYTRMYKTIAGIVTFQNEKFEYDSDGYLKNYTKKADLKEILHSFEYLDGNLVKTVTSENGVVTSLETYTYYTDKPSSIKLDIFGQKQLGVPCDETFGKANKNLLKSYNLTNGQNQTYYMAEYAYETDALGYPLKAARKSVLTNYTENLIFKFL